ncbi:MAG: NAD-dependent protein deacylase [Pirellulaceae bacterium]
MDSQLQSVVDSIARTLHKCRSVLFVTGAGISADSGLPTYRGIGGLYDVDLTEEGLPIEDVLSGEMLHRRPELTWKYLAQIAEAARGGTFNRGHEVITEMERHFPRVWTLTQNVDGYHRLAGSTNVIEIHGNMRSLSCIRCSFRQTVGDDEVIDLPPRCLDCHAILRPDVVLFGEMLPDEAIGRLRRELDSGFGAVLSVGTSSGFPYIQEAVLLARRGGAVAIEINPAETLLSPHVDYRLSLGAAAALDAIWRRYQEHPAPTP